MFEKININSSFSSQVCVFYFSQDTAKHIKVIYMWSKISINKLILANNFDSTTITITTTTTAYYYFNTGISTAAVIVSAASTTITTATIGTHYYYEIHETYKSNMLRVVKMLINLCFRVV